MKHLKELAQMILSEHNAKGSYIGEKKAETIAYAILSDINASELGEKDIALDELKTAFSNGRAENDRNAVIHPVNGLQLKNELRKIYRRKSNHIRKYKEKTTLSQNDLGYQQANTRMATYLLRIGKIAREQVEMFKRIGAYAKIEQAPTAEEMSAHANNEKMADAGAKAFWREHMQNMFAMEIKSD